MSRGLCGLVCPSHTSERGGEGYCVKEGGGERETGWELLFITAEYKAVRGERVCLLLQDLVHVCVQSVCVYYCSTYYIQSCLHLQGSQCVLNCST